LYIENIILTSSAKHHAQARVGTGGAHTRSFGKALTVMYPTVP
jgi:hypothetical protein